MGFTFQPLFTESLLPYTFLLNRLWNSRLCNTRLLRTLGHFQLKCDCPYIDTYTWWDETSRLPNKNKTRLNLPDICLASDKYFDVDLPFVEVSVLLNPTSFNVHKGETTTLFRFFNIWGRFLTWVFRWIWLKVPLCPLFLGKLKPSSVLLLHRWHIYPSLFSAFYSTKKFLVQTWSPNQMFRFPGPLSFSKWVIIRKSDRRGSPSTIFNPPYLPLTILDKVTTTISSLLSMTTLVRT